MGSYKTMTFLTRTNNGHVGMMNVFRKCSTHFHFLPLPAPQASQSFSVTSLAFAVGRICVNSGSGLSPWWAKKSLTSALVFLLSSHPSTRALVPKKGRNARMDVVSYLMTARVSTFLSLTNDTKDLFLLHFLDLFSMSTNLITKIKLGNLPPVPRIPRNLSELLAAILQDPGIRLLSDWWLLPPHGGFS